MRAAVVLGLAGCAFHHGAAPAGDGPVGDTSPDVAVLDAPPPPQWWDPTYAWRLPLAITNGATTPLPAGYQVGLQLDLDAAPCTGPRDAIRIVRGAGELTRVIDEVGTAEWTWFALAAPIAPGATSFDYWLYCGNQSPTPAPSQAKQVFDFFEGFAGTQLGNGWQSQNDVQVNTGTAAVGGAGHIDNGMITTALFGPGHAVDFAVRCSNPATADFWAGFQSGFQDVPPWLHWYADTPNAIAPDYWADDSGTQWFGTTDLILDNVRHYYSVENYGDSSMYRFEDVPVDEHTYDMPPDPPMLNVRLWNYSNTDPVIYAMARVRQAVKPPPTVTAGAPEMH